MTEINLFYWTGVVLWFIACGGVVFLAFLLAIWLPGRIFLFTRKVLWGWIWAAKVARYGFNQKTLKKAYNETNIDLPTGVDIDDVINWIGRVKEAAAKEKIKQQRKDKAKTKKGKWRLKKTC